MITTPGVFGLHANAEITYFNNSAKALWLNIISMATSSGGGGGGLDREAIILETANSIQEKAIPELFDEYNIRKGFNNNVSPTQTVLLQELERFNKLIIRMKSSIVELKRALRGEIGMNQDLDSLATALFNGFLPEMWAKIAPPTEKNLVNWIDHFGRRNKQYRDWVEIGEPKVMWLSGMSIPESYLTALTQTTCRINNWPLDKTENFTIVTKHYDPKAITKKLEHGTYIEGLYIEGARWNSEDDCLDVQKPKVLVEMMPLVQIIPIEANKLKLRGTMKVPVYTT